MFDSLSERLNKVFQQLRRRGKLSAADVDAVMREVRVALLEADVHYSVVKDFIARVRERAVGVEVSEALNPAQQVIKIVHEELIATLGAPARLNLSGQKPHVIMLAGLQGAGKTSAAAKLAKMLRDQGERVLLVAADPYRPAAVTQLQTLGGQINVPVFHVEKKAPPALVKQAVDTARKGGSSVVILDTAGRSQLDDGMMTELAAIHQETTIGETLIVVDAMTGQEALNIAAGFNKSIPLTGIVLTKMEGDARGGAAISIRSVTGIPIKFLTTGETIDALENYEPERLASRILGMGDMLTLIERAETTFEADNAREQAEKIITGQFTLEDFADQLKQLKKMGGIGQVMDMLPGNMGAAARMQSPDIAEKGLKLTEAIISSMTIDERRHPDILNASRRRRIARGAGTEVQNVNRIIKQFREVQRMMKTFKKSGRQGLAGMFR
ncbi:MAG: signal recognition particle protein [Anaerolineaceae bacterium]|nr:signal recognition particle protein [Anaerolineaceae bacterium]MBN2676894.1 signal recognition particle protein [Anaerolineaceae bacterium]